MDKPLLASGFVVLSHVVPSLLIDLKYCYEDNLLGRLLAGYAPDGVVVVTTECAQALGQITLQNEPFRDTYFNFEVAKYEP